MVYREAIALEQDVQPSVAEARALGHVRLQPFEHRKVGRTGPALVAPRRRAESDHATGPSQVVSRVCNHPDRSRPAIGPTTFFATTALSA